MLRSTFSLLFFIKKSKLLKSGEAPIYLRITINGTSVDISLKRSIPVKDWDVSLNRCKGSSVEGKAVNEYINSVRGQIFMHHQRMREDDKVIDAKMLGNVFLGIEEKQYKLMEIFHQHNQDMKKLIDIDYSPLTLQRYLATTKHLETFIQLYHKTSDKYLREVDHSFISRFELFLKTDLKCQHNSAMKHIKSLKKIINYALSCNYIKVDPFAKFSITTRQVKREALTAAELDKIATHDIAIERLALVRDLFVFQCYTGLAFVDLEKLSKTDITVDQNGRKVIDISRTKTGISCYIPLFPACEKIIEKYETDLKCQVKNKLLPVLSNQKMNSYLKELAVQCGITKNLHSHLGRHTFATTVMLGNKVPIETVSKLLGHTKLQTTQIYAKVLNSKVMDDLEGLMEKYS